MLQSLWFVRRGYIDLSIVATSGGAGTDAGAEGAAEGGRSKLVDTLGPGDYFGDRALLPAPTEAAKQVGGLWWALGDDVEKCRHVRLACEPAQPAQACRCQPLIPPSILRLPLPQLGAGLREQLLAGSWWRAPFTATALNHSELFMLPAEAWHRVLQNHADLAAELAEEAARCVQSTHAWCNVDVHARSRAGSGTAGRPSGKYYDSLECPAHAAVLRRFVARVASALPPGSSSSKGSPDPADGLGVADEKAASLRLGRIDRSMTRPRGQNSLLAAGSLQRIDVSQD